MLKRHEGAFDPNTRHVASGGRDRRLLSTVLKNTSKLVSWSLLSSGHCTHSPFSKNERQVPTSRRQYLQHP